MYKINTEDNDNESRPFGSIELSSRWVLILVIRDNWFQINWLLEIKRSQ